MLGYLIIAVFIAAWAISYVVYRVNGYDEIEALDGLAAEPRRGMSARG